MEKHASKPDLRRINLDGFELEIDIEQMSADMARFELDVKYLAAQYDRLRHEYPWKWIAIFEGKLVGVDDSMEALVATLKRDGIPSSKAVYEHMEPGRIWIY